MTEQCDHDGGILRLTTRISTVLHERPNRTSGRATGAFVGMAPFDRAASTLSHAGYLSWMGRADDQQRLLTSCPSTTPTSRTHRPGNPGAQGKQAVAHPGGMSPRLPRSWSVLRGTKSALSDLYFPAPVIRAGGAAAELMAAYREPDLPACPSRRVDVCVRTAGVFYLHLRLVLARQMEAAANACQHLPTSRSGECAHQHVAAEKPRRDECGNLWLDTEQHSRADCFSARRCAVLDSTFDASTFAPFLPRLFSPRLYIWEVLLLKDDCRTDDGRAVARRLWVPTEAVVLARYDNDAYQNRRVNRSSTSRHPLGDLHVVAGEYSICPRTSGVGFA